MKNIILLLLLFVFVTVHGQTGRQKYCSRELAAYGLDGKTYAEAIDIIAGWHSEYLEYVLNKMKRANIRPSPKNFQLFIESTTRDFFLTKGIDASSLPSVNGFNFINPVFNINSRGYSRQAAEILQQLADLVSTKAQQGNADFVFEVLRLKEMALRLTDEKEIFNVGVPLGVAINSFNYWDQAMADWENFLSRATVTTENSAMPGGIMIPAFTYSETDQHALQTTETITPILKTIRYGQLIAADVSGAIAGAYGGLGGGPAGAVAGGILGSAVSSAGNLLGQVMGNLFSWW